MRACLHSLSLVHCPWILSNSESGMLMRPPNVLHRRSLVMSRTVERFSGVRLGSGNKNIMHCLARSVIAKTRLETRGQRSQLNATKNRLDSGEFRRLFCGGAGKTSINEKYGCSINSECVGRSRGDRGYCKRHSARFQRACRFAGCVFSRPHPRG